MHTILAHLHGVCVTFLSQHTADDVGKEEESQLVVVFESQSTHIKDPPCLLLENLIQHTQQDSTTLQQSAGEAHTRESITETVSGDCACFVCDYSKVVGVCVCVWCVCVCGVCACVYIRGTLTFPIMWFNQCVIQSFEVSTLLGRYIGIFLACSVEPCVVYCERR